MDSHATSKPAAVRLPPEKILERVEPAEPGDPEQLRRERLRPLIDELLARVEGLDPREAPQSLELAGHRLELGAWERSTLRRARATDGDEAAARGLLFVVEGLAFEARVAELAQAFERGPMPPPGGIHHYRFRL